MTKSFSKLRTITYLTRYSDRSIIRLVLNFIYRFTRVGVLKRSKELVRAK